MNKITKRLFRVIFTFFLIVFLLPQNVFIIRAATTNATVYKYSPMLEDGGNIYYILRVEGDTYSYDIYKLEIATGNKTRLLSSKNDILSMMLHKDTLYYNCYDGEKDLYQTFSVSIDAKEKKTICNGFFIDLNDSSIYYISIKDEDSKLYKRDYDSQKDTLIYTGNSTFRVVKNLEGTLYFTQFKEASSKLVLYTLMPEQTKLSVLATEKIALNGSERAYPTVSDIVKINEDIYYQYGAHEGSGSYWYGTLKKLESSSKIKSIIAERLYEEEIHHDDNCIYYIGTESSEKHYRYNTKTGKTTSYTYKTTGTESFNILGDETYCAKADGKELITVSRFTSGSNKKNMVEAFIKLSYRQKKNYDYSACVKKINDILLIPVTCMDYNDTSYGWRGRCVSVTWYVADSEGKILAQFE